MATTDEKLTGQVALITGASSGIGRAIARAFLNEGADLVVVARREEGVAESDMLEADDVAAAALLMATQPKHSRITEIRMRPMVEPLFGRDPK